MAVWYTPAPEAPARPPAFTPGRKSSPLASYSVPWPATDKGVPGAG